jgi:hypothetical protein
METPRKEISKNLRTREVLSIYYHRYQEMSNGYIPYGKYFHIAVGAMDSQKLYRDSIYVRPHIRGACG